METKHKTKTRKLIKVLLLLALAIVLTWLSFKDGFFKIEASSLDYQSDYWYFDFERKFTNADKTQISSDSKPGLDYAHVSNVYYLHYWITSEFDYSTDYDFKETDAFGDYWYFFWNYKDTNGFKLEPYLYTQNYWNTTIYAKQVKDFNFTLRIADYIQGGVFYEFNIYLVYTDNSTMSSGWFGNASDSNYIGFRILDDPSEDYNAGRADGYGIGYGEGYAEGLDYYDITQIESDAYDDGYSDGLNAQQSADFMTFDYLLAGLFSTVGHIMSIQLLPNLTIGAIIMVPLVLGILSFIIGVATISISNTRSIAGKPSKVPKEGKRK